MKTYKSQAEVEKDIRDGVLQIDDDVIFNCDINVDCDIKAWNINALDIDARNIDALDIDAQDIYAQNIDARNIDARNIDALDIDAWRIYAWNIDAQDISYFSICCAAETFTVASIKGVRENAKHFCLDSEIVYKIKER